MSVTAAPPVRTAAAFTAGTAAGTARLAGGRGLRGNSGHRGLRLCDPPRDPGHHRHQLGSLQGLRQGGVNLGGLEVGRAPPDALLVAQGAGQANHPLLGGGGEPLSLADVLFGGAHQTAPPAKGPSASSGSGSSPCTTSASLAVALNDASSFDHAPVSSASPSGIIRNRPRNPWLQPWGGKGEVA